MWVWDDGGNVCWAGDGWVMDRLRRGGCDVRRLFVACHVTVCLYHACLFLMASRASQIARLPLLLLLPPPRQHQHQY